MISSVPSETQFHDSDSALTMSYGVVYIIELMAMYIAFSVYMNCKIDLSTQTFKNHLERSRLGIHNAEMENTF